MIMKVKFLPNKHLHTYDREIQRTTSCVCCVSAGPWLLWQMSRMNTRHFFWPLLGTRLTLALKSHIHIKTNGLKKLLFRWEQRNMPQYCDWSTRACSHDITQHTNTHTNTHRLRTRRQEITTQNKIFKKNQVLQHNYYTSRIGIISLTC